MIFKISTHKRGSSHYNSILSRVEDLGFEPDHLTVIRLAVPDSKMFSLEMIAAVEVHLSEFIVGQECLQFTKILSATQFWSDDGRLSGSGAIHMLSHMIIGYINAHKRGIILLSRSDKRDGVPVGYVVKDRIYHPDDDEKILNVVITGKYRKTAFRHAVFRLHKNVKLILSRGMAIEEALDEAPLEP